MHLNLTISKQSCSIKKIGTLYALYQLNTHIMTSLTAPYTSALRFAVVPTSPGNQSHTGREKKLADGAAGST